MYSDSWIETAPLEPGEHATAGCPAFVATLYDGTRTLVRPVTAADRWRIEEGLAHMSPRSLYQRFFRHVKRLSEQELGYLTQVDQIRHIAWAAVDAEDQAQPGLGVARLICEPQFPARAELALSVIDSHQGIGVGTVLLATLCAVGPQRGIETVRACVLPENSLVVGWFQRLGARLVEEDQDLVVLDLKLAPAGDAPPAARRFCELLRRVDALVNRLEHRQSLSENPSAGTC